MCLNYNYRSYKVLFIDDEAKAGKYFKKAFEDSFDIITCLTAIEAKEVFAQHADEIAVIVTDQRMPEMTGAEFLDEVYRQKPDTVRILSTAYADLNAAVDAVNKGQIYKYVTKPWDIPSLEANIRRGMEFFIVKKERDQLIQSKLINLERLLVLSRIISVILAPIFQEKEIKNLNVAVFNFLKLGYLVFDQINLGLDDVFSVNKRSVGFYESFQEDNHDRLIGLFSTHSLNLSEKEILKGMSEVLKGELSEDYSTFEYFDKEVIKNAFQGLFGYSASPQQTEIAKQLLDLVLNLAEFEKSVSFDSRKNKLNVIEIKKDDNSLGALLDADLLLARVGGVI